MLWMERFALIFYVAFNIFIFGFDFLIAQSMNENIIFGEVRQIFIFCLIVSLIVWFIFRAFDYLFAGPLRREIKKGREMIDRSTFH